MVYDGGLERGAVGLNYVMLDGDTPEMIVADYILLVIGLGMRSIFPLHTTKGLTMI